MAQQAAKSAGVLCTAWGGTENTARVILCFAPDFIPVEPTQFPICCLTLRFRKGTLPAHRDFLGAFLACNLERETIGDILIADGVAQAFVSPPAAAVLLQELHQVGTLGVQVNAEEPAQLTAGANYVPLTGTVASLRADAITAMVTHLSREKAVQLIRQGKLSCRHTTLETPAALMQTGDVFSIRGFGKFRLETVDGLTRKGRYHITILKYQ